MGASGMNRPEFWMQQGLKSLLEEFNLITYNRPAITQTLTYRVEQPTTLWTTETFPDGLVRYNYPIVGN